MLEDPWAKMNELFTPMRIAPGETTLAVCLEFVLRSRVRRDSVAPRPKPESGGPVVSRCVRSKWQSESNRPQGRQDIG